MSKVFKHPLARRATVAKLHAREGGDKDLLIIVTTLELDAAAEGFSAKNVERLHDAAKAFLAETQDLAGYVLVKRSKDWDR
jgi:predicted lipoprotein with Yx(FWY)xxD motif